MRILSPVEIVLLQIMAESEPISGYGINKLIEQRGYRNWAKIGTTSIYVGLQKLKEKGLILAEAPGKEEGGKGPSSVKYSMTPAGTEILKDEVMDCLSAARERDVRFDLGLAALPILTKEEAIDALKKRELFLQATAESLRREFEAQGGEALPLQARALFLHPAGMIKQELSFMNQLVNELKGEKRDDSCSF